MGREIPTVHGHLFPTTPNPNKSCFSLHPFHKYNFPNVVQEHFHPSTNTKTNIVSLQKKVLGNNSTPENSLPTISQSNNSAHTTVTKSETRPSQPTKLFSTEFESHLDPPTKKLIGKSNFVHVQNNICDHNNTQTEFTATPSQPDIGVDTPESSQPTMSTDGTSTLSSSLSVDTSSSTIWPHNVLDQVKTAINESYPALQHSKFKFRINVESASQNWTFLSLFPNLGEALINDKDSFTKYGSEFRPIVTLQKIFGLHPLWHRLKSIMTFGIKFPLTQLDTASAKLDLEAALQFGNHKGVKNNQKFFR